jgi:hypothetical protein
MTDQAEDQTSVNHKGVKRLRQFVTIGALGLAIVHLVWPNLAIDPITLGLVIIAIIPWLSPLFKSIDIPWLGKFEFQEQLQRATLRMEAENLLVPAVSPSPAQAAAHLVTIQNPNLALANLRFEIQTRLVTIAKSKGLETRRYGPSQLIRFLTQEGIFTHPESSALQEFVSLLNSAAHGATVAPDAANHAVQAGNRLLPWLDQKVSNKSKPDETKS